MTIEVRLRCGLWLLWFAAGLAKTTAGPADEVKELAGRVADIDGQLPNEAAIYQNDLNRGVANGSWTEESASASRGWLKEATEVPAEERGAPPKPGAKWAEIRALFAEDARPESMTAPADAWFAKRVAALWNARAALAEACHRAAMGIVEEIWFRARKPADLQPALALMTTVEKSEPLDRYSSMGHRDLYELATLLRSPEPLLFPDPEQDPAAACAAWKSWSALRQRRHEAVMRPAVVARFTEFERALFKEAQSALQRLDLLILNDASAQDFEVALKRAQLFSSGKADARPGPPRRPGGPWIPGPPFAGSKGPFDADDLFGGRGFLTADRKSELNLSLSPYNHWLAWRQTGGAGEDSDVHKRLLAASIRLPLPVRLHVLQRLGSKEEPTPLPAEVPQPPLASAVERFVQALLKLKTEPANGAMPRQLTPTLTEHWQHAARGVDVAFAGEGSGLISDWRTLSEQSGSVALFALADAATRELLKDVVGETQPAPAPSSLAATLRLELEKQISSRAWNKAVQIVALARLSAAWPDGELERETQMMQLLQQAAAPATGASDALKAYRQVLHVTQSPAAAGAAAGKLQKLRTARPTPKDDRTDH